MELSDGSRVAIQNRPLAVAIEYSPELSERFTTAPSMTISTTTLPVPSSNPCAEM